MTKKITISILLILVLCSFTLFAQNTALIINGDAFVTLNGGTGSTPLHFVINQPKNTGITRPVSNHGWIVSEGEYNYVQWNISNSGTGNYVVPYSFNNNDIPFSMEIQQAGSAGGNILFSTYHTPLFDNFPYPTYNGTSPILNLSLASTAVADFSSGAVDRWWIIDAGSYTTKPKATFTFSYPNSEWTATGNTIAEANLKALPFNSNSGTWDTSLLSGNDAGGGGLTGSVMSADATGSDLFRCWSLVDEDDILPVELISFNAVCNNDAVKLNWVTASETNNDYFTIERSADGITWNILAIIPGAGNSNTSNYYTADDSHPMADHNFYRLKQTDYNGQYTYSTIRTASCGETSTAFDFTNVWTDESHNLCITFNASENKNFNYKLFDAFGRLVFQNAGETVDGFNEVKLNVSDYQYGMYIITLDNTEKIISQKVVLQ